MREISAQVGEEDRDPDELLDHHEDEPVRDRVREEVGQAGRQQEEEADREQQREHDRARPGAAADLLLLAVVVGRHLRVRGDAERAEADLERLGERDHAAHDREPQQPVALRPGDERLGDHLDLALRPLLRVGAARGELLRRRLAHRHRPGGDAAHHHALEHGLAADRGVLGGLARPVRGASPFMEVGALTALIVSAAPAARLNAGQRPSRSQLVRVVGLGGLRDRLLGVGLHAREPRGSPGRGSRRCATRAAPSESDDACRPRRRPRVSLTGTAATAASPVLVTSDS